MMPLVPCSRMLRRIQGRGSFLVLCGLTFFGVLGAVAYISTLNESISGNPSLDVGVDKAKYVAGSLDGEIGSAVSIVSNARSLSSLVQLVDRTNNTPTKTPVVPSVSENTSGSPISSGDAHENDVSLARTSNDCNTIHCGQTDNAIPSKDDKETTLLTRNLTSSASIKTVDDRTRSFANNSTNREPSHYLIQTKGCNILDFPLSHPDIVKYTFKEVPELVCSNTPPLTEDSGLTLILREDRIADYGLTNATLSCHYRGILRVEQDPNNYNMDCDRKFRLKEEIPINSTETHIDEDAILVTCRKRGTQGKPAYQNVHFFIQPRRAQKKREDFQAQRTTKGHRPEEPLSVVILGTDSVSRGNLERHMPRTHAYLTHHLDAISLRGLTKIADNTHPNIVALLTGLSTDELLRHKCRKGRRKSKFDDCPLLWRDFSRRGYVTAYAEDTPHVGSFHHNMHGFVEQPTDYYNRPYYMAAENFTGHSGNVKGAVGYLCQGPRESISLIHNYSLGVAEELRDVPYFGYYWTTSMTHDLQKAALRADGPCYTFLKRMKEEGFLNHTVLFFVSDHGMRQGEFRSTYAGMLEERLPYANVVFPDWFVRKYPEAINNMRTNAKRLTSTYDLHVTLRDILDQNYKDLSTITPWHKKGLSLFQEIPGSRTCRNAGIPNHYCACESTKEADAKDVHLTEAAKHAVATLNEGLTAFPNCSQLRLDKVVSGRVGTASRNTKPKVRETAITSYIVTFSTVPGGAVMEASVKRRKDDYEVSSEISRINTYGNQSHCIADDVYRKYCFCKDLLR